MTPHDAAAPGLRGATYARLDTTRFDLNSCEQLMRGGSKSFYAAGRVLPARIRAPATALYAFCRVADDAIDGAADAAVALRALQARLDAVYAGRPQGDVADRALACVVARFDIPRTLLDALLEGFAWDTRARQYETLADLHDYGARVAGSVGTMMAIIMGVREPQALARAAELGVAMQLTNIARDVGEDARAGRLYLPRQWMRAAGLDPDRWLAAPRFNEALGRVVARLLSAADELYERAAHGIAALPRDCRPAIQAARLIYAEIGREVERCALDSVTHRAVVPRDRKLALLARAFGAALRAPAGAPHPIAPLPAIRFLVDAGAQSPARPPHPLGELPRRNYYERTIWVIDLFERLAERQRPIA